MYLFFGDFHFMNKDFSKKNKKKNVNLQYNFYKAGVENHDHEMKE